MVNTSKLVHVFKTSTFWFYRRYNMALNTNYGYPPLGYSSLYSSPYSSTPTSLRSQRPRFGYPSPSNYKSFSSASENPKSFSEYDSMINNYGTSSSRIDTSFNSGNRSSYNDSYNTSGSTYYSANNTFSHDQSFGETSIMQKSLRDKEGMTRNKSMMFEGRNIMPGYSGMKTLPQLPLPLPMNNAEEFNGIFQKPKTDSHYKLFKLENFHQAKNKNFGAKQPYFFSRKQAMSQKVTATKSSWRCDTCSLEFTSQIPHDMHLRGAKHAKKLKAIGAAQLPPEKIRYVSDWRCEVCSLEFTSQIPYDMHFRGAKHAKKLKANEALEAVKLQADNAVKSQDDEKSFFCELCNVKANSSLQLQTHLDGTKHKSKLLPKEISPDSQTQEDSKDSGSVSVNGKTNGSLVRTLPSDFGEPQPSKLFKFACDVCNLSVNSEVQLQQHLNSKKHQNKVEGIPVTKGKRIRKDSDATEVTDATKEADTVTVTDATKETDTVTVADATEEKTSVDQASNETFTKVVGVKTLASSFVQGETLQ